MARNRGSGRARRALPLVMSFLLVALLAAGLGYAMGLFLTGALGSDAPPEPGDAGEPPAGAVQDPGTAGGAGPDAGGDSLPGQGGGPAGQDGQPGEPAGPAPEGAGPAREAAGEQPAGEAGAGEEAGAGPQEQAGTGREPPGETRVDAAAVTLYVIQVGVFSSLDGAQAALDQLRAAGFDGTIVPGDGYRVWTGLFTSREQGRPLAGLVADAGFETFIAEHTVGGSGLLRGGSDETRRVLRAHLQALPDRVRRMAAVLESGTGIEQLASELLEAERELERLDLGLDLEDAHESLRRLYAQARAVLQEAATGFDALPVLAGAPEAAAEAAAILAALDR